MGIFDDVFDALLTNDAGARTALRHTRALDEEVSEQRAEIAALRREVTALQRTLATVIEVLDADNVGRGQRLRDRVLAAARGSQARSDDADDASDAAQEDAATFEADGAASPYRDAPPRAPARAEKIHCATCGKALAPDDPELSLARRGRVCVACFQRGG